MTPILNSLFLCDDILSDPARAKPHLIGILNAIRPPTFPYVLKRLCVFAQLIGGWGEIECRVRVVSAKNREVVYESAPVLVHFSDRRQGRYPIVRMLNIALLQPGEYWVELSCSGQFVDDAVLLILGEDE